MAPSTPPEGTRRALGSRYELVEVIGAGAMGEVWRAWDRTDQVYRAAKLLRGEFTSDPEILTRFIQERSILITLRHPHIVEVYDLVVEGDNLAIVMELVEGPGLRGFMRSQGTLAPGVATSVAASVLDALAAAHAVGTLHRDVKPDNILLASDGGSIAESVKLTDFGIARLAQESTVQATGLLGTPSYMPPELFERGVTSAASDVYAVGIMLYEMLAGRTPFAGSGTAHTMGFRHLSALPPQLEVPPSLWVAIETMLAKDPRQRLSAAATAAQLRELEPELVALLPGPKMVDPTDWERVSTDPGVVQSEIRPHHVSSTDDVGGTRLRGGAAKPKAARAVAGDVSALVDGDDQVPDGFTQVRSGGRRRAEAPTLTSAVTVAKPSHKPLILGLVAAVVVVAVVLGLVLGGVFSSGRHKSAKTGATGPAGPVQSKPSNQSWPVGLSYTGSASYADGNVTLSLDFRYQYGIAGQLMVVLPALNASGQQATPGHCVDSNGTSIQWTSVSATQLDSSNNLDNSFSHVPCGYGLTPTSPGTDLPVTAVFSTPTAPTSDQLDQWLANIYQFTQAALGSYSGNKQDYALQELVALKVSHQQLVGQNFSYSVYPYWYSDGSSGQVLGVAPLYSSSDGTSVQNPGLQALFGLPATLPFSRIQPPPTFIKTDNENNCPVTNFTTVTQAVAGGCTISASVGGVNSSG